jgi:hypothetical protein
MKKLKITIKRMRTKFNIKIKYQWVKLKKKSINDLRPNTLQLEE